MLEEWRPAPGWEVAYEVSSLGRVRSISRVATRRHRWGGSADVVVTGRTLRLKEERGYMRVTLNLNGKKARVDVHPLICGAFHGPRPERAHAAHWNGKGTDNAEHNLRWATPQENSDDKRRHGTVLRGEEIAASKLKQADVARIRQSGERGVDLAKSLSVTEATVSRIRRGKSWAHDENRPVA